MLKYLNRRKKKTINFSSNMAGGYEPGTSADLMFRVTTTMTIALDEDNETSEKKNTVHYLKLS